MKENTKTKVYYTETDGAGKSKSYITSETAWNKIIKDITEANAAAEKAGQALEPMPTLTATGTFGYKFAETVDEAVSLAGGRGVGEYENIEVFLGVFNYAASLRQDNEANDVLSDSNFAPWEGVKDVSYAVAQKVERAKMTNEEKALGLLAKSGFNISAEQLRAALQMIAQAGGQAASAS